MIDILREIDTNDSLNRLSYPLCIIDNQKNIVWVNKKFEKSISIKEIKDNLNEFKANISEKIILNNEIFYELQASTITINKENYKLVSFFNISKRKKLEKKLLTRQKMFESLTEELPEPILVCNEKIIYTNPAFEKLIGLSSRYLLGKSIFDLLDKKNKEILQDSLNSLIESHKKHIEFDVQIPKKNGNLIWVNVSIKAVYDSDETRFVYLLKDVTKRKEEKEKLRKLANLDQLTAIYNRRKFEELFELEYKRNKRYQRSLSCIFFDIDHFKKINDNYGHDVGDIVLKELSRLVLQSIRETDFFARWGGEEFIILLPETSKDVAFHIAENLRKKIVDASFTEVNKITVSLGVAELRNEHMKSFIKRVDQALYKAKNSGRNCTVVL